MLLFSLCAQVYKSSKLGKPYWYNKSTGVTSWEPPPVDAHGSGSSKSAAAGGGDSSGGAEEGGSKLIEGEARPQPLVDSGGSSSGGGGAGGGGGGGGVGGAGGSGGAGEVVLPPGWRRYVSTSTGKPYFYNKATKETRWEPPT